MARDTLTAASKNKPEGFISPRFGIVLNRDCTASARFCPQSGDNPTYIKRCARGDGLTAGHFESSHGITPARAHSGDENLPTRPTTAAHAGDIAAPSQLVHNLIRAAIEQVHLSVDAGKQPRRSLASRDGRSGVKRGRCRLFADSGRYRAIEKIAGGSVRGIQAR